MLHVYLWYLYNIKLVCKFIHLTCTNLYVVYWYNLYIFDPESPTNIIRSGVDWLSHPTPSFSIPDEGVAHVVPYGNDMFPPKAPFAVHFPLQEPIEDIGCFKSSPKNTWQVFSGQSKVHSFQSSQKKYDIHGRFLACVHFKVTQNEGLGY